MFSLSCQDTSPEESDEIQLHHFKFVPYDGPPINPNDRALEDAGPAKQEEKLK